MCCRIVRLRNCSRSRRSVRLAFWHAHFGAPRAARFFGRKKSLILRRGIDRLRNCAELVRSSRNKFGAGLISLNDGRKELPQFAGTSFRSPKRDGCWRPNQHGKRTCAVICKFDKALEVDCYPDRRDLNVSLLKIAREHGTLISLGTDAHHAWQLEFIELGLAAVLRAKLPPQQIVNFMSIADLKSWIGRVRDRSTTATKSKWMVTPRFT